MNANEELYGSLGQAVETIRNNELPEQRIAEISQRVIGRLSLETQLADSMQAYGGSRAFPGKQKIVMCFLAASVLIAASVGMYVFQIGKLPDGTSIATNRPEPSMNTSLMQFVPLPQAFTVQRPGSQEPTDVLVICEGPSEVVVLGNAVAVSPALGARYIHVVDPKKPELSRVLRKREIVGRFVLTPDQRQVLTPNGQLLDLDSEELRQLPGDWNLVQSVRFVANDRLLVTRFETPEDCVVSVLSYPELNVLKTLIDVDPGCLIVNWMNEPENWKAKECAIVFTDRKIRLTSTTDFKQSIEMESIHPTSIDLIVNSADGKLVASATEQEVLVHDASSGKLIQRLFAPKDSGPTRVDSMAFSQDGKYLAVGFAQHLVIFDTATWQLMKTFPSASGGAGKIIWSQDAKSLVTLQKAFLQRQQDGNELLVHPSLATWSL
jgi:WD40 repeat protein